MGFGGALADLRGALNIVGGDVLDAGLAQAFGEMVAGFAEADESDSWGGAHPYSVRCFLWGLPIESGIGFIRGYCERKFGVSTGGLIEAEDLGVENRDSVGYSALEYEYLLWALPAIPFPSEEVVFVDYGAGKGRALAAAAAQPFRRVVGVEISAALVEIAQRNLARLKRRRAGHVEIHHADAAAFAVPDDANVFFFFNPFGGATLARVVERIRESWTAHPRELVLHLLQPRPIRRMHRRAQPWLRKVHETSFCGFYRLASAL